MIIKKLITYIILIFLIFNIGYTQNIYAEGRFLPGTYNGGYNWLKTEVLNRFFVDIRDSSSILDAIDIGGYSDVYNNIYEDTVKYLTENDNQRNKKALSILSKNKYLMLKYIDAIHKMETGNNISFNPSNNQGIFQLYYLDSDGNTCNTTRSNRYTSCEEILKGLYEPGNELSKTDLILEFLDFTYYWDDKYKSLKYFIDNNASKLNMRIVYDNLFDDLGLQSNISITKELYELYFQGNKKEDFTNSIIIKDFYNNNFQKLQDYGFKNHGELYLFNEFYETALIGGLYNGTGNIGKYVFDNAYISNNPDLGIQFEKCATDGCATTTISKQVGLIFNITRKSLNTDMRKGYIIYSLILKDFFEKL